MDFTMALTVLKHVLSVVFTRDDCYRFVVVKLVTEWSSTSAPRNSTLPNAVWMVL